MEKGPGCRIVLAFLFALIAASFIFSGNQCAAQQNQQGQKQEGPAVAMVGTKPVTESAILATAEQQKGQYIQQMGAYPPGMEATNLSSATFNEVEKLILIELATRNGLKFDDASIKQTLDEDWKQGIAQARMQLIVQNKLKADASESDFVNAFKAAYGGTPDEKKAQQDQQIDQLLADPAKRPQLEAGTANRMLSQYYDKKYAPTDQELKDSYTTFKMKRVWLDSAKHVGEDLQKKAEEIRAEITSGKLTFEQAMNKYSNDTPPPKKTVSEATFELDGRTRAVDPEYKALQTIKVGEVSPVLSFAQGVAIFKMLGTQSELPKDFDAKKEEYRASFAQATSAKYMQEELAKLRKEGLVKWDNESFHVLYDWFNAKVDPTLVPKEAGGQTKFLEDLQARLKAAMNDPKSSPSAVAFGLFGIQDEYWPKLPDAEKKKRADERIEILTNVLQFTDSPTLRLELVDLFADKKDGKSAGEQLYNAAVANQDFGPSGQKDFGDINARMDKLKGLGLLDGATAAKVEKVQSDWRAQKVEKDKYEADQKKQAEEERKKFEAEQKKQAEEQKKKVKPVDRSKTETPAPQSGTPNKK